MSDAEALIRGVLRFLATRGYTATWTDLLEICGVLAEATDAGWPIPWNEYPGAGAVFAGVGWGSVANFRGIRGAA